MDLKDQIKAEAGRLGFDLCGITSADPAQSYPRYRRWIEAGRQAGMGYLAQPRALEVRADPHLILPGVKTILVVAARYARPEDIAPADPHRPSARVAAYAWGQDYHLVIPDRLRELAGFIAQAAGHPVQARAYTDTGPILERDLAQRAGLGWIGKNSCLINPRSGSYFFLGELFLDLEIEPDTPIATDLCGSCRRCIDACPTGCILPDRTLDAGRCISYLTIENKGDISPELRPLLGEWAFGCDICQMVCPWNLRFASPSGETIFSNDQSTDRPEIAAGLRIDSHEFNRRFKNSPIQRARRKGFLRNLSVVAGNHPHAAFLEPLEALLTGDTDPIVRKHAAWALGRQGAAAGPVLLRCLNTETDPGVQVEIQSALDRLASGQPGR